MMKHKDGTPYLTGEIADAVVRRMQTIAFAANLRDYAPVDPEALDEIVSRFETQTACADCGEEKSLQIDHCHNSGKFRDLVCAKCNNLRGP